MTFNFLCPNYQSDVVTRFVCHHSISLYSYNCGSILYQSIPLPLISPLPLILRILSLVSQHFWGSDWGILAGRRPEKFGGFSRKTWFLHWKPSVLEGIFNFFRACGGQQPHKMSLLSLIYKFGILCITYFVSGAAKSNVFWFHRRYLTHISLPLVNEQNVTFSHF